MADQGKKMDCIEFVQNQFPFFQMNGNHEYVVIFNQTTNSYDLKGWKLTYEDLSTGTVLHTHHFSKLRGTFDPISKLRGTFDPKERLCVLTGQGVDRFVRKDQEARFPGAQWDLFADQPRLLMGLPRVRLRLLDETNCLVDAMTIERIHPDPESSDVNVFIGHGHSVQWRVLKDHLQDHHGLKITAYEMGPRAGLSVKEVLEDMLTGTSFAILVLTGEDLHGDGELHARENVVHESGLFQGRLGFKRAILLLEDGVKEFSNIVGVNQIRFARDNIRETFDDVLATLNREFKYLR